MADKKSGKKRLYFNPEAAKKSAKRRKESEYLTKQLNETATEFVKYTSHASTDYNFVNRIAFLCEAFELKLS